MEEEEKEEVCAVWVWLILQIKKQSLEHFLYIKHSVYVVIILYISSIYVCIYIHTWGIVKEPWEVNERELEGEDDREPHYQSLFSFFREFSIVGDVTSTIRTVKIMSLLHLYLIKQLLMRMFLVFFFLARSSLSFCIQMLIKIYIVVAASCIFFPNSYVQV